MIPKKRPPMRIKFAPDSAWQIRCAHCDNWLAVIQHDGQTVLSHKAGNPRSPKCPYRGKLYRTAGLDCTEVKEGQGA